MLGARLRFSVQAPSALHLSCCHSCCDRGVLTKRVTGDHRLATAGHRQMVERVHGDHLVDSGRPPPYTTSHLTVGCGSMGITARLRGDHRRDSFPPESALDCDSLLRALRAVLVLGRLATLDPSGARLRCPSQHEGSSSVADAVQCLDSGTAGTKLSEQRAELFEQRAKVYQQRDKFSEQRAKFYTLAVALALGHLHS